MAPKFVCTIALLACIFTACQSDYEKMVTREKSSGIRQDSIFMGMHFGMSRSDFFQQCLTLNAKGIVTNGPKNSTVLYTFGGYKYPLDMNFYPAFKDEKIWKMDVYFSYQTWAPWNKQCYADKAVPDVLDVLGKYYGQGFLALKTPQGKPFWVLVNGNRQTLVKVLDDQEVAVEITDLTVDPPAKAERPLQAGEQRPAWEKH